MRGVRPAISCGLAKRGRSDHATSTSATAPTTAPSGGTVNFGLNVTNYGPNISDSFVVELPVPTGLSDFVVPAGCVLTGATYSCTVTGPLAVGASISLNFEARVSSASSSTVTIVGSVQGTSPRDPVADNNTRTVSFTTTPGSDLSIAKSRSPAGNPLVGDSVTFTLAAQYTGDSPNNMVITDNIPVGYRVDHVTWTPGWSCTTVAQTVTCARATGAGADAQDPLPCAQFCDCQPHLFLFGLRLSARGLGWAKPNPPGAQEA